MSRDIDGPAQAGSGIYGVDAGWDRAACVIVPAPFEATVSYRAGTARGPAAILHASHQVDLLDLDVGYACDAGIHMEAPSPELIRSNAAARPAAVRVVDHLVGGRDPDPVDSALVDRAGEEAARIISGRVAAVLQAGKLPVLLGGDHSTALGSIAACARTFEERTLGVLQIDAHADLRRAFEGFRYSHASVMHNALETIPNVRLVQVGLRDLCEEELDVIRAEPRVHAFFDRDLRRARLGGRFAEAARAIAEALPADVYISFDIDGLDPALCPQTGTPVPGGLSFDEAVCLLEAVCDAGKRIVGLDLNEVSPGASLPGTDPDAWDAIVGARLLYKLIGFALRSRGHAACAPPDLPAARGDDAS